MPTRLNSRSLINVLPNLQPPSEVFRLGDIFNEATRGHYQSGATDIFEVNVRSMALFPRREWPVPPPFGGPSAIQGQQFYIFLFVAPWHPSEPGPSDIEE